MFPPFASRVNPALWTPQVVVIDQISPEQVYDFHSKVTAVVLSGQRLSGRLLVGWGGGDSVLLQSLLCCCLQTHLLHTDAQPRSLSLRLPTLSPAIA